MTERNLHGGVDQDRAVSVTVGYVLNLAIASLLLTGLFVAGGSFVQSEREAAIEGELTVVGERVAADLMTVDRLANASENPSELTVERRAELPTRVSGVEYTVSLVPDGGADGAHLLRLESDRVDVVVEIPVRAAEPVDETTVEGGDVTIEWDDGAVVIRS
ncbi:hypothetical protein JCM18237_18080 [Halorubrum luteum]